MSAPSLSRRDPGGRRPDVRQRDPVVSRDRAAWVRRLPLMLNGVRLTLDTAATKRTSSTLEGAQPCMLPAGRGPDQETVLSPHTASAFRVATATVTRRALAC